jgi:enoyl-CoA hydratase/carnithine racemase
VTLDRPPFTVEPSKHWVTLWLDTPGGSVNVFGPTAARQLGALLKGWARKPPPAIVLRSRKRGSFINGAGLLYAHAATTPASARRVSAPVRATYEALASCGIPSVAVIEGNCFGCGLELALACTHRIACDDVQTRFVMTELRDYSFSPLFGGTYRLPRLLGVRAAAELVLGGATWSAREAKRRGLVDVWLPSADERALSASLAKLLAIPPQRRKPALVQRVPSALVELQPPLRRPLYAACARLLEQGARGSESQAAQREAGLFAASVTTPSAKRAMSFFFIRHMARSAMLGSSERAPGERRLVLDKDFSSARLRALLTRQADARPPLVLGGDVPILEPSDRGLAGGVCFPLGPSPGGLCELVAKGLDPRTSEALARELDDLGFEVVRTSPEEDLLSRTLARTVIHTLQAELRAGSTPAAIASSWWAFGFTTPLRALVGIAGAQGPTSRALAAARPRSARVDVSAIDRLCAALVTTLKQFLETRALSHPVQADLLAQVLLGFPREEGSLFLRSMREGLIPDVYGMGRLSPRAAGRYRSGLSVRGA